MRKQRVHSCWTSLSASGLSIHDGSALTGPPAGVASFIRQRIPETITQDFLRQFTTDFPMTCITVRFPIFQVSNTLSSTKYT